MSQRIRTRSGVRRVPVALAPGGLLLSAGCSSTPRITNPADPGCKGRFRSAVAHLLAATEDGSKGFEVATTVTSDLVASGRRPGAVLAAGPSGNRYKLRVRSEGQNCILALETVEYPKNVHPIPWMQFTKSRFPYGCTGERLAPMNQYRSPTPRCGGLAPAAAERDIVCRVSRVDHGWCLMISTHSVTGSRLRRSILLAGAAVLVASLSGCASADRSSSSSGDRGTLEVVITRACPQGRENTTNVVVDGRLVGGFAVPGRYSFSLLAGSHLLELRSGPDVTPSKLVIPANGVTTLTDPPGVCSQNAKPNIELYRPPSQSP